MVTAGDRSPHRFPAGSVLLLDDAAGDGNAMRLTSGDGVLIVAVTLADRGPAIAATADCERASKMGARGVSRCMALPNR